MSNDNNPSDSLPGGDEFGSPDGNENVNNSNENLSLAEINTLLGKNFKDKATALKSLKETQDYVGKAGKVQKDNTVLETKLEEATAGLGKIKEIETELFYSNNPQYKPYRDTIAAMGGNPAEVVEKDAFKKIFTDLIDFEKEKSKKSVLESNPRIGQAKTKIDDAKDKSVHGDYSGAGAAAAAAVIEAFDLQ